MDLNNNKTKKKPNNRERKMSMSREYKIPIEAFEHRFHWLFKRMISFEELDDYRVFVTLDNNTVLLYDNLAHLYYKVKRFDDVAELTDEEYRIGFAYLLKRQLRINGMTQKDLAGELDISINMMSRYMNHAAFPNMRTFCEMLQILNCDANDLIPCDYIILD